MSARSEWRLAMSPSLSRASEPTQWAGAFAMAEPKPTQDDSGETPVRVRLATAQDMPHVHKMIQELAQYEGYPDGLELSVDDLVADGFGSQPPWFFVLLAEGAEGGAPLGQALCNRAYSSWTGRAFYIEDLFVRPEARRAGVGMALVRELAKMAEAEGASRVDWHVQLSNGPALSFYSALGARDLRSSEGRAALRLDAPAIRALARARPDTASS